MNKLLRESEDSKAQKLTDIHRWIPAPDPSVNYQKALILFVTMAKGAGLHRKSDWCTCLLNELEVHRDTLGSLLD